MIRLRNFITQSIDWYNGLHESISFFHSLLSRENGAIALSNPAEKTAFDLLAFCSLQRD